MSFNTIDEVIAEAERTGRWLYTAYQGIWMSPDELRAENAAGRFRWGPVNWQLRDPREYVAQAEEKVTAAQAELARVRERTFKAILASSR